MVMTDCWAINTHLTWTWADFWAVWELKNCVLHFVSWSQRKLVHWSHVRCNL